MLAHVQRRCTQLDIRFKFMDATCHAHFELNMHCCLLYIYMCSRTSARPPVGLVRLCREPGLDQAKGEMQTMTKRESYDQLPPFYHASLPGYAITPAFVMVLYIARNRAFD